MVLMEKLIELFCMAAPKFGDNVDEFIESAGISKWKNAPFLSDVLVIKAQR